MTSGNPQHNLTINRKIEMSKDKKPKQKLRYMLFQLLRKLIADHTPAGRHEVMMSGNFTLEELVVLQKTINGCVYHKARRDNIIDAAEERIEHEQL